jgi:hypothetical protein
MRTRFLSFEGEDSEKRRYLRAKIRQQEINKYIKINKSTCQDSRDEREASNSLKETLKMARKRMRTTKKNKSQYFPINTLKLLAISVLLQKDSNGVLDANGALGKGLVDSLEKHAIFVPANPCRVRKPFSNTI